MSDSQSSKPKFKSKLPRPVVRSIAHGHWCTNTNVGSKSNLVPATLQNASAPKDLHTKRDLITHADTASKVKEETSSAEEEFQVDPKALESILSNKGVTAKLLSSGSSSANQVQSVHRSSMYYQPPSRLSMVDSHAQFKEKMKLLKEQIKTLDIKCRGTPKSQQEQASNASSSSRPVSLYYQMKPLQKKQPSTPTQTTPAACRLQSSCLSERKCLSPKDTNSNRLCRTTSKLNTNPRGRNSSSSAIGKENKVRFKLFPSPIREVPENTGHSVEILSSDLILKPGVKSSDENVNSMKSTAPNMSTTFANKDPSSTVTSAPTDVKPFSNLQPTTPQSALPWSSHSSSINVSHPSKCPPIMSASTVSTWTIKDSVCTPKSSVFTPVGTLPKTNDVSLTAVHLVTKNTGIAKDSPKANTPSRIVKNQSRLHQVPQRTVVADSVQSLQRTPQRMNFSGKFVMKPPAL